MLKLALILAFAPLSFAMALLQAGEAKASQLETSDTTFDSKSVTTVACPHIEMNKSFENNCSDHFDLNDIKIVSVSYTFVFGDMNFFFNEKEDHSLRYSGLSPPSSSLV